MKLISTFLAAVTVIFCYTVVAAGSAPDGWMRVQSDDGEFSIEVPRAHRFFFNAPGFRLSRSIVDLSVTNMYMLTAFQEDALVSFEVYDGPKRAMDILYKDDLRAKKGRKVSEITLGDVKVTQVANETDQYSSFRWFFCTNRHVYILPTASRKGEVPAMKRFLDSLVISGDVPGKNAADSTRFSALNKAGIDVQFDDVHSKPATPDPSPAPDPTIKPYVLVTLAMAPYIYYERDHMMDDAIRIRLKLGEDGFISGLTLKKSLAPVLARQAMFAALRSKFLPKEKDGLPVPAIVIIDYGF
jgi:hypothetical protein